MKIKQIIALCLSVLVIFCACVTTNAESIAISAILPSDGSEIELAQDGSLELSCNVSGGEIVKFLLDGELVAEFEENGNLSYSLSHSKLGLGNKKFEVIVLDSKGEIHSQSVNFETYASFKGKVNPGVSTEVQDFNAMSSDYATKTGNLTSFNHLGWSVVGNGFKIKREAGKSGESGDYSLGVYPTTTSTTSISLDGWTQEVTSGIISLEYDWTLRPLYTPSNEAQWKAVAFTMLGLPSYTNHGGIILQGSRKLYNTDYEPPVSGADANACEWTNMRYEYNVDTGKCSLWINDTKYWDEIATTKTGSNNLSQLVFQPLVESGAGWWVQNSVAYFMLDNVHLYKKEQLSLELLTYTKGGTPTAFSDGNVPFGADSVTAEFSAPIGQLTNDDIEIYADGEKITHSGVTIDGKKLTVGLPAGISNKDITIKTRQGLETFGDATVPGGISFSFHIGNKINSSCDILVNSSAASSNETLIAGDVVSASYTAENLSNADQDILLVLTVRENGSLVSVSAKEIKALANDTDTFALPPITIQENGNYDISLVAVGGFLNPQTFN